MNRMDGTGNETAAENGDTPACTSQRQPRRQLVAGCWLDGAAGQRNGFTGMGPGQAQSSLLVPQSNKELRQVVKLTIKADDTNLLIWALYLGNTS